MSDYRLFETAEFKKQYKKIAGRLSASFDKKLREFVYPQLKQEPHFGPNIKKLRGYEPDTWRYRIGNYRVFFIIDEDEKIVFLTSVDDRKDAYR